MNLLGFSSYVEGWGLYAEQLADELGAYETDPVGRIGYLQSLMFRAARLVVDTGIHSKGWSREQGIRYMMEAYGDQEGAATSEVERYCGWPGQACAYKVGHNEWVAAARDGQDDPGVQVRHQGLPRHGPGRRRRAAVRAGAHRRQLGGGPGLMASRSRRADV